MVTRLLKAKNKIRGSIRKLNQVPIDKLKRDYRLVVVQILLLNYYFYFKIVFKMGA